MVLSQPSQPSSIVKSEFAFAQDYTYLSSKTSKDFFKKLQKVVPFQIKRVQTDNGAEFHKSFRGYLEKKDILYFFNYPRKPQMNAQVNKSGKIQILCSFQIF